MTSTSTEVEPAPVFVDQTGARGRRLRGLGWLVGVLCAGCVVAMVSGLVGTQSQAPALTVPATADTTPPSQYLNAPLPAAPGAAEPGQGATATATTTDAAASATATTTATAGTTESTTVVDTGPTATATAAAGTTVSGTVTDTGPTATATTTAAGTAASTPATATVP
ncbi:hypothetical protein [Streptomyces sp. NPDC127066]|uniref:hypothetical protein n=1 Tax=Streptomyces sp. NPDC127066 TaxID=3347125 RepID=UPI003650BBB1